MSVIFLNDVTFLILIVVNLPNVQQLLYNVGVDFSLTVFRNAQSFKKRLRAIGSTHTAFGGFAGATHIQ